MIIRYTITARCTGCGGCHSVCPVNCIDTSVHPMRIDSARCLLCGRCAKTCPINAIISLEDRETP